MQGLQPHEPTWPQETALLQQEVRLFRQNAIIVYMKLRWILMHWRLGRRAEAAEEGAEVSLNEEVIFKCQKKACELMDSKSVKLFSWKIRSFYWNAKFYTPVITLTICI